MKIRPSVAELFHKNGQTDMTRLIVAFRHFANAPKSLKRLRVSATERVKVKVKVKVTLIQALRLCTGRTAYRGSRGIALLFHDHGTRRGEGSASRPGRT